MIRVNLQLDEYAIIVRRSQSCVLYLCHVCLAISILCAAPDGSNIMTEILCATPDGRAFCKICICRVGVAVIFMCGHFEIAPLAHRLMNYGSILNTSLPGAQKVSPFNEDF